MNGSTTMRHNKRIEALRYGLEAEQVFLRTTSSLFPNKTQCCKSRLTVYWYIGSTASSAFTPAPLASPCTTEKTMQRSDRLALGYLALYAAFVFFFPWTPAEEGGLRWDGLHPLDAFSGMRGLKNFGDSVAAYPYVSGFLKVGLLATFGEMLKNRRRSGAWQTPDLLARFVVWGLYGALFTLVFALFAKGVAALMGTPVWPFGQPPALDHSFGNTLIFAFSTSLWMNLIFCYPMMLTHEWCNSVITARRLVGGAEFLESLDKQVWGGFLLKTIVFFWIPAHTITFCLPPDFRVLMSAVLSLALGFLLTLKPKPDGTAQCAKA